MKSFLAILALRAASLACAQAPAPKKIDASRSSIRFVTRQMNVPVEGQFKRFDATVAFDPAKPEATRAEFEVDLGSIDLGNAEGETEAKRKTWLDVAGFPKARFVADSVRQTAPGKYTATGPLTIKGTSHPVTAPFTLDDAGAVRTVEGQFTLKRLGYRIGEGHWADTDTVADEVLVKFRFALPK